MRLTYTLFLCVILFASCNGGKALLKEAEALENGGLQKKAFERYEQAYKQHGKVDGLIGMRRLAQADVNRKFAESQALCAQGNYENALNSFDEAFRLVVSYNHLEITAPSSADFQRSSCLSEYVNFLYEKAETAFRAERYDEAQEFIRRLQRFDRNNKNAQYLELLARIYPAYNKGVKAMELGYFREAFSFFNEVVNLDAGFRDAKVLMEESLEKAKFTIAYVPIKNEKVDPALQTAISGAIKQNILASKSPFIELVERERMDQMIQEQMNSMSGIFDENSVIEAGKLLGSRYIITGEVIQYEHKVAQQRSYERKAYLGPTSNSKKVRYTEYRLGRGLDASFKFQILDAETGKLYASQIVPFSERDNVTWSDFEGDYTMLYPGEWKWQLIASKEDVVYLDQKDRLMKEFTGRRGPISEQEMRQQMITRIATQVARAVEDFKP